VRLTSILPTEGIPSMPH